MESVPWTGLLWCAAAIAAIHALVTLCTARRDVLRAKLQTYIDDQAKIIKSKQKILLEHRHRAALAKRIAQERADQESSDRDSKKAA